MLVVVKISRRERANPRKLHWAEGIREGKGTHLSVLVCSLPLSPPSVRKKCLFRDPLYRPRSVLEGGTPGIGRKLLRVRFQFKEWELRRSERISGLNERCDREEKWRWKIATLTCQSKWIMPIVDLLPHQSTWLWRWALWIQFRWWWGWRRPEHVVSIASTENDDNFLPTRRKRQTINEDFVFLFLTFLEEP